MFECHGREQGTADGNADAALRLPARPRPALMMAVTFPGYRDGYLSAYRDAYRTRSWQEDRQHAERLAGRIGNQAVQHGSTLKQRTIDRVFEEGWQHGFHGKASAVNKLSGSAEEVDAYTRGYRIGVRDRDYARARDLRREHQRDHDRAR